jgi:hypothetical protein
MRKSLIGIGFICFFLMVAGSAMAQQIPSAKFAAAWSETAALVSIAEIKDAETDTVVTDSHNGFTLASIKVPQDKELLVGVSAQIGLITDTSVKGKNGGSATALAGGEAYVTVFAVPRDGGDSVEAEPGQIILSKRIQALTATLGGVIQSCPVTCSVNDAGAVVCDPIDIAADCIVTPEEIGLFQETTAAHHFNFVLPDLKQGVYDIKAFFTTGANADVDICDEGEACNYDPEGWASASAYAKAVVYKTMLTVQQVRAVKGSFNAFEIVEIE